MPIHGQYSMMVAHSKLAQEEGIPENNIVVAENGQVIKMNEDKIFISKNEVPASQVFVDGLGIGDVGEIVLRDRQTLGENGMFVIVVVVDKKTGKVIGSPDIISRGFVYLKESKELLKQTRKRVIKLVNNAASSDKAINWYYLKDEIRKKVGSYLFKKTERKPMVLPVIIEN
jgi:ribonuclease J